MQLPTEAWSAHSRRLIDERAAGWLTAAHLDVLQALAALVAQGNQTPSVRQIAALAHVSPRTVQRARRVAEERGLLTVEARFEIADGQPRQAENRYDLRTPVEPVRPRPRRQKGGGRTRKKLRKAVDKLPSVDMLAAQAALAARRAVVETRMLR
jgi:DNA-binding transcriptional MocR family regulator